MQADMLRNPKCNLQMNEANYAWTNGHIDFKIRKKKFLNGEKNQFLNE